MVERPVDGWSDDQLLEQLAERAAEKEPIDPRLERLALGDGPVDAELAREQPELRELYRPLDDALLTKIVRDNAAPPRLRSRVWARPLLAAAAAAAAIIVFASVDRDAPLPMFTLEVGGARSDVRAPSAEPGAKHVFREDGEAELVLRPDEPIRGPLFARAYRDGRALPARFDISESGAARLWGRVADLFPGLHGEAELALVIDRRALPDVLDDPGDRRVLRVIVEIVRHE